MSEKSSPRGILKYNNFAKSSESSSTQIRTTVESERCVSCFVCTLQNFFGDQHTVGESLKVGKGRMRKGKGKEDIHRYDTLAQHIKDRKKREREYLMCADAPLIC